MLDKLTYTEYVAYSKHSCKVFVKEKKHEPAQHSCVLRGSSKPRLPTDWNAILRYLGRAACGDILLKARFGTRVGRAVRRAGSTFESVASVVSV
jgi:hypothetical protein